jgi:hypothetical protein
MPRVAICCPSGDMVHKGFAMSLFAMGIYSSGFGDMVQIPMAGIGIEGSLIARNRNQAIAQAQKLGVDYALFLDSDMKFPMGTLRRLLGHKKDVTGGTYIQRDEPHRLLGKWPDGTQLTSDRIHEVDALPGGCLLIKMSVFEGMTKPYFRTPAFEASDDDPEWIQGEDYYFCEQAKRLGYSIWLDVALSMELGHIGCKVNTIAVQQAPNAANETTEANHGQAASAIH